MPEQQFLHGVPIVGVEPHACRTCGKPTLDVLVEDPGGSRRYFTGEAGEDGAIKPHYVCEKPPKTVDVPN